MCSANARYASLLQWGLRVRTTAARELTCARLCLWSLNLQCNISQRFIIPSLLNDRLAKSATHKGWGKYIGELRRRAQLDVS